MKNSRQQLLDGAFATANFVSTDDRGSFAKPFQRAGCDEFEWFGCAEFFYSWSHKDVIRGMHLQIGDGLMDKIVTCVHGRVLDVLVDLRQGPQFGAVASIELLGENPTSVFIPKGVAHGFLSLSERSLIGYLTSELHRSDCDTGVRWDSIEFDWPVRQPIISSRDRRLPALHAFEPVADLVR